jgi:hypothetical protein
MRIVHIQPEDKMPKCKVIFEQALSRGFLLRLNQKRGVTMDTEEARKIIVENLKKKSKSKSKFYLKDFNKFLPDEKPRAIKNLVNKMVADGILEYWSSGSTTLIGLKGEGKQAHSEDED